MAELTCGERVVRCLLGEPIDRIPFGVGIGWFPWTETLELWRKESGNPELDLAKRFGYDGSFLLPALQSGLHPPFESRLISEDDTYAVYRDGRGITVRALKSGSGMPEWLDYPVKAAEDWQQLKEERLRIDDPSRVEQDWDEFRTQVKATGAAVQVGAFPWGVFGTARDLLGVEELLVSFHAQPDLVRDIMDHLTSLWLSLWEKVAAEVQIDHIHIWEDMAGRQGSLISPKMIEEFMMPCYDRIAAFARAHGVRLLSVDSDGDCRELVPMMMKHGVNAFFPFEVQAGNDVLEYRRSYPELGVLCGLDKRALAATRKEVEVELERCRQMVKQGRYVPGFDHLIAPDAKWENFQYAAEAIKRICYDSAHG